MNYFEMIEKYLKEGYIGTDNTCNGICSKCGECCGNILPLDQDDVNNIQEYVLKNKVFMNTYMLVMRRKIQCPYYNGNKEKGCSIYEARPKICRYYKCDKKMMTVEEFKAMKKAIPIDMWELATDIEKEMKQYYGLNKKARKTVK